jgi:hypothetical protein
LFYLDENVGTFGFDMIDPERSMRGKVSSLATPNIELSSVTGAMNNEPLEISFGQGRLGVRTEIIGGIILVFNPI